MSWFATVTAWHTTNQIRMQLAGHVPGLDHEFHRSHTPGELIQRVDGDVTSVSDFLGTVVPKVVGAAAMVLGMVAVLAVVDWRLAVGAIAYVVLSGATIVRGRFGGSRLNGTVRDNVTLFDAAPTDSQVEHALGRVGLTALVTGGIHRELGAGGAGLSAGEAQLLALARVWLRDPDLVVLDEAPHESIQKPRPSWKLPSPR